MGLPISETEKMVQKIYDLDPASREYELIDAIVRGVFDCEHCARKPYVEYTQEDGGCYEGLIAANACDRYQERKETQ